VAAEIGYAADMPTTNWVEGLRVQSALVLSRSTYPTFLKAFLRTEEAVLDAELDAGGTLKGVGSLFTAYAKALPRCR